MLKLRLLTGPRAGRQLRVSDTKPVSVGRRKGRLRLHDSRVSKQHAEIAYEEGVWVLRDFGSANGTYVNRQKAEGLVELEPGDLIQMGRVLIKVTRCDGIGMDTLPDLPDALADDDLLGMGPAVADADQGGEFDLDALFDEQPEEPGEPAGVSSEVEELQPNASELSEVATGGDEADEADADEPELLEAAFDEPVDEDDSFFADLSEATDTSDGLDIDVRAELEDPDQSQVDEDDPFLSASESEEPGDPEDNSDQISLEDESGMGPRSAGTTLLTTVDHDDLMFGEDRDHEDSLADSAASSVIESDAGADEEDDAPAVVGLHLDHAPPQQPQAELESDSMPESDEDAGLESAFEQANDPGPEPGTHGEADLPEHEEALPEPPAEEDVFDVEPEVGPTAELEPEVDFESEPEADAIESPATEAELEVVDELEQEPELPEPGFEEVVAEAEAAAAESTGQASEHPDSEASPGGPQFDIDAAFDALSEGLDDSVELPAIGADGVDKSEASASDLLTEQDADQSVTQENIPESLIGSQLDVGFIQDALSQLEENAPPDVADNEPPQPEDGATKAAASPPLPPSMSPAAPGLPQPPPGLNPESVNPPAEPRAYPPHDSGSSRGRWFFTLLLFLGIGGTGGFLISQNYDRLMAITGRDAGSVAESAGTDNEVPTIGVPREQAAPQSTEPLAQVIVQPEDPAPVLPADTPSDSDAGNTTGHNSPDPFAAGPGVLGPDALAGITRGQGGDQPFDQPSDPSTITPPGLTPAAPGPDPGPTPPADAAEDTPPVEVQPETQDSPPAIDQPPARIVFLVDASGSLVDSLPQMVVWLNRALQTVEPEERFAVYFFKADKPIAIKPAGMQAPSRELFSQLAKDWLNPEAVPVFPSGRSNPDQSISKALSHKPTDLYLLSDDAFALSTGSTSAEQALTRIRALIGERDVRVHGVQFFYRGEDSVLETLANETDGTFEFVRERVVPDAEPIDLLEELGGE